MNYPHLFSPITLGNLTFRNRIFASPTGSPPINPPTYLTPQIIAFYELRAKGGAASVSLGDGIVHTPTGLAHPHKLRFDDPLVIPSLTDVARSIRQYGAVPTLEMSHAGKYANRPNLAGPNMRSDFPCYGPSAEVTPDGFEILEMPQRTIEEIVRSYGDAAKVAKLCGFGMICVHGGHGWLLEQFMSPKSNRRTDEFGGSLENRCRFALMAVDAVRAAVGPGFPIEFRMSGDEFTPGGYTIDEGVEIAKLLAPHVDLLHISAAVHDDPDGCVITHPSMFEPHGRNVYLAARVKQAVKDTPVATVGALQDPAMMEDIIASGKADVVEMSRCLMADPELPRKAAAGREDEINQCMRCFHCLNQTATSRNTRCNVNPVIGREQELKFTPPAVTKPKKVLVVGGGPAGMQVALTAAERGHDVTLCEAQERLGGLVLCEAHVPFKAEMFGNIAVKQRAMERAGVKILLNTAVDRAWAERFAPDVIVCAAGSLPAAPPIPGLDLPHVKNCLDLKSASPGFGRRVVILGAGLVGAETAVHLLHQGKTVTLIEQRDDYAVDATIWHKQALRKELTGKADLRLCTTVLAVTPEGVRVSHDGQEELLPADTVFAALGLKPRLEVRDALRFITPEFYEIGDCVQPGILHQALSQGLFIGRQI